MYYAALAPLLIISLLQLFVLWGLRLSVERIEKNLTGTADDTLSKEKARGLELPSKAPPIL